MRPRIIDFLGNDITDMVFNAAETAGVPVEGLLALMIAESALNPQAERWYNRTREAQIAIEGGDWLTLQDILDHSQDDVSFGYTQQILKFHWWGDRTHTVLNALNVRHAVFNQPARDVLEGAQRYTEYLRASNGNLLKALVGYNYGSIPPANSIYWIKYAGNVSNYKTALVEAKRILEGSLE